MLYITVISAALFVVLVLVFVVTRSRKSLKQFDFDGAKQGEKEMRGPLQ